MTKDANRNGKVDTGDLICVSTECFHVYSANTTEIKALARYNIDIDGGTSRYLGTGLQNTKVLGFKSGATRYGTTVSQVKNKKEHIIQIMKEVY